MITVLSGDNSFETKRALDNIVSAFDGEAERYDGGELELVQLPDLLAGGTLFSTNRLVIIRDVSANKKIWEVLPDWFARVSGEVHLVLVESNLDKRTRTYKELQKNAEVKSFALWGDRDVYLAEKWVGEEAKRLGLKMDKKSAQVLVKRVGLDQWLLHNALKKLSVLDGINPEIIEHAIEANPSENVFYLLDSALRGDIAKIQAMISNLRRSQDPYMTFGLLSKQVFELTALAMTNKPSAEVAKEIGSHPYGLSQLSSHAKQRGKIGTQKITKYFADADYAMKSTPTDPWIIIENSLIKTASA